MKNSKIILPDLESLKADIREYLDNDMVNTVLILSDEVYSAACNDEEFMDSLMGADTLLASNTLMVRDIMKKNNGITVEVEGKEEDYSNFELLYVRNLMPLYIFLHRMKRRWKSAESSLRWMHLRSTAGKDAVRILRTQVIPFLMRLTVLHPMY